MSTGPEHYATAERLIAEAAAPSDHDTTTVDLIKLSAAHVHATLALAAATALTRVNADGSQFAADVIGWQEIAGGGLRGRA